MLLLPFALALCPSIASLLNTFSITGPLSSWPSTSSHPHMRLHFTAMGPPQNPTPRPNPSPSNRSCMVCLPLPSCSSVCPSFLRTGPRENVQSLTYILHLHSGKRISLSSRATLEHGNPPASASRLLGRTVRPWLVVMCSS